MLPDPDDLKANAWSLFKSAVLVFSGGVLVWLYHWAFSP